MPTHRPTPGQTREFFDAVPVQCSLARNLQDLAQDTTSNFAHAMAFSLERYWKLKEAERLAPAARYEEELLWANWNPEVPSLLRPDFTSEQEPTAEQSKASTGRQGLRRKRD
jgi:hypothetical protein